MPGILPCQTLGTCRKKAYEYISKQSNQKTKRYGIFIVLLLEIISIPLAYFLKQDFIFFWYPFLVNNAILILLYKNYCDRVQLKYCERTIIALRAMIIYFALNTFVMCTKLMVNIYFEVVTYLLLSIAFVTILKTIWRNKK